jgi:hypothetical protein
VIHSHQLSRLASTIVPSLSSCLPKRLELGRTMLEASITANDATVLAVNRYDVSDEMKGDLYQKDTKSPNPFPSAIIHRTNILRSSFGP